MADRYWVGGTAAWNGTAGTKWATTSGGVGGASVPTSVDDVFFDAASTGTCTISSGNFGAKSINCTGFSGTLAGTSPISIYGDLILSPTQTYSYATTISVLATCTINTAGKTLLGPISFNFVGTVTLASNITSQSQFAVTNAALAMDSYNITCRDFFYSNAGSITSTSGSPSIYVTGNSRTVVNFIGGASCPPNLYFYCTYAGFTGTRLVTAQFPGINPPTIVVSSGADTFRFNSNTSSTGSIVFDPPFTGTWSDTTVPLVCRGSVLLNPSMTFSHTSSIQFRSNTAYVQSSGKLFTSIEVTDNASVILLDSFQTDQSKSITLTNGFFDANNYAVSTGRFVSSGISPRTLNLGSNNWAFTAIATTVVDCGVSTNLIILGSGSIYILGSGGKTFKGGSKSWPALYFSGSDSLEIQGSNTFGTLSTTASPLYIYLQSGTTTTVTNFIVDGTSGNPITIASTVPGSQATLSKSSGTVTVTYCQIQDNNATGGATWDALSLTNTNLGNNAGWLFPASSSAFLQFF